MSGRGWCLLIVVGLAGCPRDEGAPVSPTPGASAVVEPAPMSPEPVVEPTGSPDVDRSPAVEALPDVSPPPEPPPQPLPPFPGVAAATVDELGTARRLAAELAPLAEVEAPLMQALSAADDDPARDRVLLEFLHVLERRGAYGRLAKLTRQVLGGERPTLPRAELRYLQGLAWVGLGQAEGARQAWAKLAELDDPVLGVSAAAEVALLAGDLRQAARLARQAVEAGPDRPEPRSLFARAVVAEHPELARRELEALVARHPDDLNARFQLAAVADRLGDDAAAAEHLAAVITLGESAPLPLAQLRRARALWRVARFAEAEAELNGYLEAHPDDLEALVWRAACWHGAGQTERAAAQWQLLDRERGDALRAYLHAGGRQLDAERLAPLVEGALE